MKIAVSTRIVLIFKNVVVKIPIDKRGYLQGKNEIKTWKSGKGRQYLAPLLWEKFGLVCMVKCQPLQKLNYSLVAEVKKELPQFNFNNCDLFNIKNWGLYKGRPVLLDYGINLKISKMYK